MYTKRVVKLLFKLLFLMLIILLSYLLVSKPSNKRNWEFGMEKLAQVTIRGNEVEIKNIRDFHYAPDHIISTGYINQRVNLDSLKKVWFIQEPFGQYQNITAHTYFVFDFENQKPLVVSVEARREKGQKYDALLGLLNQYELIYLWGSEEDETVRRVVFENNKLYMYPLKIPNQSAWKLFLQLVQTTHSLETNPRFYNSLVSNCTNELAKAANQVKPGAIPFNKALFLPGAADEELYKLGFIPNDKPLNEIRQEYYISGLVREYYNYPDFSQKLRLSLKN